MVIVALCFMLSHKARAQAYRQLTVNDFAGTVPPGSEGLIAYTSCNVTMNYVSARTPRDVYRFVFDVQLVVNKSKSWIDHPHVYSKDMLEGIMRHEQGHYQVAYLMQQEMLRQFNQTRFTRNYANEITNIFNSIKNRYRQLNTDYDEDTQHMLNRKQQSAWETWLNRQVMQSGNLVMN